MYKIFHGFHLVEAYQDLKKAKRLAKNQTVARCIKLTVAITLSLILWLLPIDTFGIEGLTVIEQRLISIFIFATLMWVFEAVPAWTTSVLIVVLLLLTVSDSSLYNPQIQISAESGTKRSNFRQKNKTKRSKNRLQTTIIKPEQKVNEDLCSGFVLS